MEKSSIFNWKERAILDTLKNKRGFSSINEISNKTGMSWTTCKKWLIKLFDSGLLIKQPSNTTNKYKIDFDSIYKN